MYLHFIGVGDERLPIWADLHELHARLGVEHGTASQSAAGYIPEADPRTTPVILHGSECGSVRAEGDRSPDRNTQIPPRAEGPRRDNRCRNPAQGIQAVDASE